MAPYSEGLKIIIEGMPEHHMAYSDVLPFQPDPSPPGYPSLAHTETQPFLLDLDGKCIDKIASRPPAPYSVISSLLPDTRKIGNSTYKKGLIGR